MNKVLLILLLLTSTCYSQVKLTKDSTYTITSDSSYIITKAELRTIYQSNINKLKLLKSLLKTTNKKAVNLFEAYEDEINNLKQVNKTLTEEYDRLTKANDSLLKDQTLFIQQSKELLNTLDNKLKIIYNNLILEQDKQARRDKVKLIVTISAGVITNVLSFIVGNKL